MGNYRIHGNLHQFYLLVNQHNFDRKLDYFDAIIMRSMIILFSHDLLILYLSLSLHLYLSLYLFLLLS